MTPKWREHGGIKWMPIHESHVNFMKIWKGYFKNLSRVKVSASLYIASNEVKEILDFQPL